MPVLLLLLSLNAFAEKVNLRNLTEKTHTRDNTYCRMNGKRIEIQIRSHTFYTEPQEKQYGEFIFYYPKSKPRQLKINSDKLNTYRLFAGQGSLCSKSLGFAFEKNKIAVLFLKENRPYLDKLTIQFFDNKTATPGEIIHTDYPTDKAEAAADGFFFRTMVERSLGSELGKVKIQDNEYIYQDRDFQYWMKYSPKGFEIAPSMSFTKSTWKDFFKDEKDFLESTQWDERELKFKNTVVYMAVNHQLKKECLLFVPAKLKLTGSESGWHCK